MSLLLAFLSYFLITTQARIVSQVSDALKRTVEASGILERPAYVPGFHYYSKCGEDPLKSLLDVSIQTPSAADRETLLNAMAAFFKERSTQKSCTVSDSTKAASDTAQRSVKVEPQQCSSKQAVGHLDFLKNTETLRKILKPWERVKATSCKGWFMEFSILYREIHAIFGELRLSSLDSGSLATKKTQLDTAIKTANDKLAQLKKDLAAATDRRKKADIKEMILLVEKRLAYYTEQLEKVKALIAGQTGGDAKLVLTDKLKSIQATIKLQFDRYKTLFDAAKTKMAAVVDKRLCYRSLDTFTYKKNDVTVKDRTVYRSGCITEDACLKRYGETEVANVFDKCVKLTRTATRKTYDKEELCNKDDPQPATSRMTTTTVATECCQGDCAGKASEIDLEKCTTPDGYNAFAGDVFSCYNDKQVLIEKHARCGPDCSEFFKIEREIAKLRKLGDKLNDQLTELIAEKDQMDDGADTTSIDAKITAAERSVSANNDAITALETKLAAVANKAECEQIERCPDELKKAIVDLTSCICSKVKASTGGANKLTKYGRRFDSLLAERWSKRCPGLELSCKSDGTADVAQETTVNAVSFVVSTVDGSEINFRELKKAICEKNKAGDIDKKGSRCKALRMFKKAADKQRRRRRMVADEKEVVCSGEGDIKLESGKIGTNFNVAGVKYEEVNCVSGVGGDGDSGCFQGEEFNVSEGGGGNGNGVSGVEAVGGSMVLAMMLVVVALLMG